MAGPVGGLAMEFNRGEQEGEWLKGVEISKKRAKSIRIESENIPLVQQIEPRSSILCGCKTAVPLTALQRTGCRRARR